MDEDILEDLKLEKASDELVILQDKKFLPIMRYKLPILYLVEQNNIVVIAGETGSGKSTRKNHSEIPRFLYEAGWTKKIAVVLSRRLAAVALSNRLSSELPRSVGYKIRFDDKTNSETSIIYMTDGIFMKELQKDPHLQDYSVIILDDAHERNLATDLILGLLTKIVKQRPELKIIITSATLDAESFLNYFSEFKVQALTIEGRLHPVDVYYLTEPCKNYIEKAFETVINIEKTQPSGDVLVFLTGLEDINLLCAMFRGNQKLNVFPLHASLSLEEQLLPFAPSVGKRKVIISTNLAETAVTIEGIVYVIDSCFQKVKTCQNGIECLGTFPVSKSQARQRAGRAGRVRAGKCYRLCTLSAFSSLEDSSSAEILRSELSNPIFFLKSLGIHSILNFPFLSSPGRGKIMEGMEVLYNLGITDEGGNLTETGKILSEFPVDVRLGVALLNSCCDKFRCSKEILAIVAMLSVQHVFTAGSNESIVASKVKIGSKEGDLVTFLNIFENFLRSHEKKKFCSEFRLNFKALNKAVKIREQLKVVLGKCGLKVVSCEFDVECILRCLVTGLFSNVAQRQANGVYRTFKGDDEFYLHPSSVLTLVKPMWIVFSEVIQTDKRYLVDCSEIDADWLTELVPHYFEDTRATKLIISHKKVSSSS